MLIDFKQKTLSSQGLMGLAVLPWLAQIRRKAKEKASTGIG
jgi:hypothetical protein